MTSPHRRIGGFAPIGFPARAYTRGGIIVPTRRRPTHAIPAQQAEAIWRISLAIAKEIEGSNQAGEQWMRQEAIAEFGGLTATDLIEVGQGGQVIGFLLDVLVGSRD
jgi:hypothetical protein